MKNSIKYQPEIIKIFERMENKTNNRTQITNLNKKKNYRNNSEIHNLLERIYKNRQNIKNLDEDNETLKQLQLESYQSIYYSLIINIYFYGQFLKKYNPEKDDQYYKKELYYFNDSKEVERLCQVARATIKLNGIELEDDDEYFLDF